jgi:4-amino-4-deoxy-L-arabinose transferase-like glycosyltransferase
MKSFLKRNYPILIIVVLAASLRFIKLGTNPIGFNDDEAAFGYNAYSLIRTFRDEWGRLLPFPVFESFGDWKLVLYLYMTAASQLVLGVNEFATRFPSALIGTVAVVPTYFLGKELFNRKVGLFASLLLAVSPWHIIASRNAFESDILIFLITLGTLFFVKGLGNKKYFIFSLLAFILTFYTYRSSWLFVPLFVASLVIFNFKELKNARLLQLKYLIICLILLAPLIPAVLTFKGQSRFFQESFIYGVTRTGIINEVNEKRGACYTNFPDFGCNGLYNKYNSFIAVYANNFFENLSWGTYFTKGTAGGYQSFSNRGLFYAFELPLLLTGIAGLLLTRNPASKILFAWILLVPVGASFTGVGNPGRLNIFLPAPQIIEAFGFFFFVSLFKKILLARILYGTLIVVLVVSFSRLLADMFFQYPLISARAQRYGYKQLFTYLYTQKDNYIEIAVSRRNDDAKQYIHHLFFNKIDPYQFLYSDFTKRYRGVDNWQVVDQIGNFRFYASAPSLEKLPPKSLLAVGEKEVLFPVQPIHTVYYPNGDKFFEVYDVDHVKDKLKEMNESES